MTSNQRDPFNTIRWCPHCNATTQFDIAFPSLSRNFAKMQTQQLEETLSTASFKDSEDIVHRYMVWRCLVCSGLLFVANYTKWNETHEESVYPSRVRAESKFGKLIPDEVTNDFEEGLRCFEIRAYRATVAMCRRALQAALIDQGATKSKKLQDQIDELNGSRPDRITNDIRDWAHTIRVFGNWGAHPDDDGLKDVDERLAREVIDFLMNFFQYVYVMPTKVADAHARKSAAQKKP